MNIPTHFKVLSPAQQAEALFNKPKVPTEIVKVSKGALHQISQATYVAALTNSLVSNKYALQLEMATCLAVFMAAENVGRDAKQNLLAVYANAGYDCAHHTGDDYKTVSRRINVGALLFTHIGRVEIENWCGGAVEMMVINSIVQGIEPLNLRTIDGILSFVGKPILKSKPTAILDQTDQEKVNNFSTDLGIKNKSENESLYIDATQNRRITDTLDITEATDEDIVRLEKWLVNHSETPLRHQLELKNGFRHIDIGVLHVSIPPSTTKDDIIKAAMAMLALAESMSNESKEEIQVKVIKDFPQFLQDKTERLSENTTSSPGGKLIRHKKKATT